MKNRRNFLKNMAVLAGGLVVVPNDLLSGMYNKRLNTPYPIEVGTAISIAQFALSSSRLFQGASSTGVSELQIKMLNNLSNQLKVLQDTLALIINEINEVKLLLNGMPEAVVNEITTADIRGNIHSFDEMMRVYSLYDGRQRKFVQDYKEEVVKLIERVRKNRNVLLSYNNYLNIPLMSAALYMEYNCMCLINEKEERIVEAVRTYRDYFARALYSHPNGLMGEILILRQKWDELYDDVTKKKLFSAYIETNWGYGYHFLVNGHYYFSINNTMTETEMLTFNELKGLGLIGDKHVFVKVEPVIEYAKNGKNMTRDVYDVGQPIGTEDMFKNIQSVTSLPTLFSEEERIKDLSKSYEQQINFTLNQLYASSACVYSGDRSLNFCQQFEL